MSRVVRFDEGQAREPRGSSVFEVEEPGAASIYEVELSADELLALSRPRAVATPETDRRTSAEVETELGVEYPITSDSFSVEPASSGCPARVRRVPLLVRIGLGTATLLAVVAAFAVYASVSKHAETSSAEVPITQARTSAPAVSNGDQHSVRFANPFDHSEVFEFPAGTSKAQARERVGALLTKRAHERAATARTVRGSRAYTHNKSADASSL